MIIWSEGAGVSSVAGEVVGSSVGGESGIDVAVGLGRVGSGVGEEGGTVVAVGPGREVGEGETQAHSAKKTDTELAMRRIREFIIASLSTYYIYLELISEMVSEQNPNACQMHEADVVFNLILIAHCNRSATSCSGVQPSIAACNVATTDRPAF